MAFSGSAQAAGDCDLGYACGYENASYGGASYGTARTTTPWTSLINRASSASANGASCENANYYDTYSSLTGNISGFAFTLNSRSLMAANYRDPNLSNGAGGSGSNWNDRIEATTFTGC